MSKGTTATRAPNTAPAIALPHSMANTDTGAINRRSKVCCPLSQGDDSSSNRRGREEKDQGGQTGNEIRSDKCLLTMNDKNMNTGVSTPDMSTGGLK